MLGSSETIFNECFEITNWHDFYCKLQSSLAQRANQPPAQCCANTEGVAQRRGIGAVFSNPERVAAIHNHDTLLDHPTTLNT